MQPILFTIPWLDLPVYGYGVMLGLSFVIGWYLTMALGRYYGLSESRFQTAIILAVVFSIVGARLFHVFSTPEYHWTLMRILNIREGGLVAYGGYIFGVGAAVIYWMAKKSTIWPYLDAATPGLALGLGLTRLGCFLRGCCYGVRSDSALAISFPEHSLVVEQHTHRGWDLMQNGWSVPVLPTQLFASATGLLLFLLTLYLLTRMKAQRDRIAAEAPQKGKQKPRVPDGSLFLGFVGAYSLFRFLIEFIRDDGGRGTVGALSTSQFIALILLGVIAFLAFYWRPRHQIALPAPPEIDKAPKAEPSQTRSNASKPGKKKRKKR